MKRVEIGDRVRYTALFLRRLGPHVRDRWQASGVVVGSIVLSPRTTLAVIKWGRGVPEKVNIANLERDPPRGDKPTAIKLDEFTE